MLKITDINRLKEFGFKEFKDRVHGGYADRGTESGWRYSNENNAFEVITNRKDWEWRGSPEIGEIAIYPDDYDSYPSEEELNLLYDLIAAGIVVKE